MSQYARNNPDQPPVFEAFPGAKFEKLADVLPKPAITQTTPADVAAHTSGPWKIAGPSSLVNRGSLRVESEFSLVAVVNSGWGDPHANARLIAAAPDLLAALRSITEAMREARRFIVLNDSGGHAAYNETAERISEARAAISKATT